MKILIFGGTFDPVHNGHIALVEGVQNHLRADRIMIIPTFSPPHKQCSDLADGSDRFEMCRLAFANHADYEISDIELKRHNRSYTVDTLEEIHAQYPDAELFLLCGADMFLTLRTWRNYKRIIALAAVCAAPRNGDTQELSEYTMKIESDGGKCEIVSLPLVDISSTQVRLLIQSGKSIGSLVPKIVQKYILNHHLYL